MKKLSIVSLTISAIFLFAACGGNKNSNNNEQETEQASTQEATPTSTETANPSYDPHRGEGKFASFEPGAINAQLVTEGKAIYNAKCQGCHKLTDEKLVGPGWAGITKRHSGAWILNFITNPDAMLDQDPELQKQLEICMVRMPNQNLTDADAKAVYDFMRENDKK